MLNLNSIMIGTKQLKALGSFYEKVLGKPADMTDAENGFFGWQVAITFPFWSIPKWAAKPRTLDV